MTFGRITALLTVIFVAFLAFIFWMPHMPWFLPVAAAEEARGIDDLLRLMMVVGVGLYIFIQGFLLYFVWLYRRRPEDGPDAVGRALHGDNRLEIAWTVVPTLFVVVLTALSYQVLDDLQLGEVAGERVIAVEARQFFWSFSYPETGLQETGELTLEKGVPVTLEITADSEDVIHSFWVPEFRLKQDATPGFVRRITFTPTETGTWPLRCAEFCGIGHSQMLGTVTVLESEEYLAWQERKIVEMESKGEGLAVYQAQGCGACHTLGAANATGQVGPTHEGLGATAEQRSAELGYTSAEEYIRESIRNPNAHVVEGYPPAMPSYDESKISESDMDALVEFLMEQQ